MPTGDNKDYTFTGKFLGTEAEENAKKEIHIHIEHIENLDITFEM